jgi:excisionase family DNA binding protein
MKYYSIKQVADSVGLSRQRIHQIIESGKIISEKFGRFRLINETEFKRFKKERNK